MENAFRDCRRVKRVDSPWGKLTAWTPDPHGATVISWSYLRTSDGPLSLCGGSESYRPATATDPVAVSWLEEFTY